MALMANDFPMHMEKMTSASIYIYIFYLKKLIFCMNKLIISFY